MFPSMISKAATVDVICNGTEGANSWDGAIQLVSYLILFRFFLIMTICIK